MAFLVYFITLAGSGEHFETGRPKAPYSTALKMKNTVEAVCIEACCKHGWCDTLVFNVHSAQA